MSVVLGLDLRDVPGALAVDSSGRIVGRDVRGSGADRLGVAVRDPLAPGLDAIIQATAETAGVSATPRIVTRGAAIALAEQWQGSAKGARLAVAIVIDDSVYAGIALDGQPFAGAHGLAGSAGWLALNPVEREDYRRHGCLEAEVGLSGIVRRLVWRIKSGDQSSVLERAGGSLGAITARHVFEGARAGDGVAVSVVRDTARYIGMAVANFVAVVDPDVVVVGGLIAEAADLLIEPVRAEAGRRLPPATAGTISILPASLGADGAALGAARAALTA